jgi:hypothetical protein
MQFFTALYACLRNPSRAVFQFYPETDDQIQLITSIARRAGFGGGIVVDYPNSKKARKVFLVLMVGSGRYAGAANANANRMDVDGAENGMPRALEDGDDAEAGAEARRVVFERRREKVGKIRVRKGQKPPKDRDWVLKKKEVRPAAGSWPRNDRRSYSHRSSIDNGERRVCLMTRSTPVGNDGRFSDAHQHLMSRSSCVFSHMGDELIYTLISHPN